MYGIMEVLKILGWGYFTTKEQKMQKMHDERRAEKRKQAWIKYLFIFSIIGVQLINFIIFYVIQNGNSILMAFQIKKKGVSYWSFDNFKRVYEGFFGEGANASELTKALMNTFKFYGLGLIMMPIALLTSYFMYKKVPGHKAMQIMFFIPSILAGIVWSTLYKEIVGMQGPIVKLYQFINGTEEIPLFLGDSRFALKTVMAYTVWMGIAGNFILYGGAMSRIPTEVIEAGKLDGITWYREFAQVVLPLVFPTVGTQFLLGLTGLFTASGNILFLTGGAYGTNTISFLIFQNVYGNQETSNTYNYASCVGFCFTILTIPLVFVSRYFLNKIEDVQY